MSTLAIRNIIMHTVVSAVLLVAAFDLQHHLHHHHGKQKDIAILKSMGFRSMDIKKIFVIQGCVLGVAGVILGLPLGCALMYALAHHFQPAGGDEPIQMPIDWSAPQFSSPGRYRRGSCQLPPCQRAWAFSRRYPARGQ